MLLQLWIVCHSWLGVAMCAKYISPLYEVDRSSLPLICMSVEYVCTPAKGFYIFSIASPLMINTSHYIRTPFSETTPSSTAWGSFLSKSSTFGTPFPRGTWREDWLWRLGHLRLRNNIKRSRKTICAWWCNVFLGQVTECIRILKRRMLLSHLTGWYVGFFGRYQSCLQGPPFRSRTSRYHNPSQKRYRSSVDFTGEPAT